jgi:hypothetical protein
VGKKKSDGYFLVTYRDPLTEKVAELKARSVDDSSLGLSFVRLSDFVFDTEALVVKPDEEAQKKRYESVKSLHLSIYAVVSVAEVGEPAAALSFQNDRSNLVVLPGARKPPPKGK